MKVTSEIYLTKKYVTNNEWLELIKTIANYNGIFRPYKISITNESNKLRYFVTTRCSLPTTINKLDTFLLKPAKNISVPKMKMGIPFISKIGSNIVDIINFCEIRNKGNFEYLEINIVKLADDRYKKSINFYLTKDGIIKKYKVVLGIPQNILSVNFEGNKRYFFKESPKYLDISKSLHLLSSDVSNSILKIDTFPYIQGNFYLNQNSYSFDKHSVIFGSSGCGKSKFISLMIHNIYKNANLKQRYKFIVIDPHAALENDIGGIAEVIDFRNDLDSIDLFVNNSDDIVASTELLLDLFKTLLADQFNSKLERVLRHSVYLLLTDKSFNFSNLRNLLLDLEYRTNLIKKLTDKLPISVIEFFLSDFNELKTKSYGEAISPLIGFVDEMEMLPVFNGQTNYKTLKDTINNNFLTLFSLDRTKIGDKVTKTIAGLIMQQLLTIIQRHEVDEHIIFIVDEVAVVENPILARFLSEARKYNLSLILAGQYFNQISGTLKNAIFANVINYYIFRVSKIDAGILVDNFNMKVPLDDTKERKIKILTELNDRECITRINSNGVLLPAFKAYTLDYTSIPRVKRKPVINNSNFNNNNNNSGNMPHNVNQEVFSNVNIDNDDEDKSKNTGSNTKFTIGNNVNLKDILISTSSSRKDVDDER